MEARISPVRCSCGGVDFQIFISEMPSVSHLQALCKKCKMPLNEWAVMINAMRTIMEKQQKALLGEK
jgi:hypothetical protein